MSLETILSQHDLNQIDFGGDAAINTARRGRPQGSWDAGEYGMSLAEAQAQWDAAQTPEARAMVEADLRQRALRRASLDNTNGKVQAVFARKLPWHGLGETVSDLMRKEDVLARALNWKIFKQPRVYRYGEEYRTAENRFDLIRSDTGAYIAEAGPRYTPLQNDQAFDFMDEVLQTVEAKYESAGAMFGGERVWILAHLPKYQFEAVPGDLQKPYALFSCPHVPGEAAACFPTWERVECANTWRQAIAKDGHKGIRIAHTGDIKHKIKAAQEALGIAVSDFSKYKTAAQTLASWQLPQPQHYFHDVLDAVLDITQADALKGADVFAASLLVTQAERDLAEKSFARKIENRANVLEEILSCYDSPTCNAHGITGTAWSAWNAVTEYADHRIKYRGTNGNRASRRMESMIEGAADNVKQVAYQKITALTR